MTALPLPDGPWSIAKGETPAGELVVVRLNRGLAESASRGELANRVEISVDIQGQDAVPSPEEYPALSEFEDSIVDQLSASGAAAFAAVTTEGARRVYVLYVRDAASVEQRIQQLAPSAVRVSLATHPDPTWSWYKRFA